MPTFDYRVILASLPEPAVIQMMLVDRERRLLTIRNTLGKTWQLYDIIYFY